MALWGEKPNWSPGGIGLVTKSKDKLIFKKRACVRTRHWGLWALTKFLAALNVFRIEKAGRATSNCWVQGMGAENLRIGVKEEFEGYLLQRNNIAM